MGPGELHNNPLSSHTEPSHSGKIVLGAGLHNHSNSSDERLIFILFRSSYEVSHAARSADDSPARIPRSGMQAQLSSSRNSTPARLPIAYNTYRLKLRILFFMIPNTLLEQLLIVTEGSSLCFAIIHSFSHLYRSCRKSTNHLLPITMFENGAFI